MEFSYFRDIRGHISQPLSLSQLLQEIRDTRNAIYYNTKQSIQARQDGEMQKASKLKEACGAITPSCFCTDGHEARNITRATRIVMLDLDHVPLPDMPALLQKIKGDEHTLLCYVTNSQEGIRIFFRWEAYDKDGTELPPARFIFQRDEETHPEFLSRVKALHALAWNKGKAYYEALTGLPCDEACKDITRLSFLAHDDQAYLNEQATALTVQVEAGHGDTGHGDRSLSFPVRGIEKGQGPVPMSPVSPRWITGFLNKNAYTPGHRHAWWLKLGGYLKYVGVPASSLKDYKREMLNLLARLNLITPDDPSLRSATEIDEALQYGYDTQEKTREDRPDTAPEELENELIGQIPCFPDDVYNHLPVQLLRGLKPALAHPEMPLRRRDALLMALLTNYSAVCSNARFHYGVQDYSLNLAFMTLSPPGNGKGIISHAFQLVKPIDRQLEEQSLEKIRQWEQSVASYQLAMQDKKLSVEEKKKLQKPDDRPGFQMLVMPETTSKSQMTTCMYAMGKHGLIINSTEISSVVTSLKQDAGNYADLLCKATMNEPINQFYKVDNRPIKIEHPKLSLCLSGTFDSFHTFIPTLEDGLFSRFLYLLMEPYNEWIPQNPEANRDTYADLFQSLGLEALHMWQFFNKYPTQILFTPQQWEQHTQYWSGKMEEQVLQGYDDRLSILTRHGLAHCKIAALLTMLRQYNTLEDLKYTEEQKAAVMQKVTCTDDDFLTAQQLMDCLLQHAQKLSTTKDKPQHRNVKPMNEVNWVEQALETFGEREFRTSEWEHQAASYGQPRRTALRALKNLALKKRIKKLCHGSYMRR